MDQTRTRNWKKIVSMNNNELTQPFKSIPKLCKETKLREFHFKLLHRIIVKRKELCKYQIKPDSDLFTVAREIPWNIPLSTALSPKHFFGRILDWLNKTYKCTFAPKKKKEMLFGINGNTKALRGLN